MLFASQDIIIKDEVLLQNPDPSDRNQTNPITVH